MLNDAQKDALEKVAHAFGWDLMALPDVALMAWAAFHYYVIRLPE